jgi:hypothetical protein
VASAVSLVCPDVDLFGNFNLNPADITLGLQLLLPCCLLNLAIMAPDYSSWKVPQEPTIEAQQKMAEALLAWTANKQAAAQSAKDRSSSSSSSSGSSAATSDPPAVGATAVDAVNHASSSASSMGGDASASSQHGPVSDSQESGSSNSSSQGVGSSRGSSEAPGMTPPWLMEKPDPPLPLPLARLKDALLLAQVSGHATG